MQYKSGYSASNSYAVNAYDTPVASKEPFATVSLAGEISGPCGSLTVFATDFVGAAGEYSTFLLSKSPTGPWTASLAWDCEELGAQTLYVQGDGDLVVPADLAVQDNQSWCDGCP